MQKKKALPDGESVLTLEFELDAPEVADFATAIKSNLNGTLPIRIALGRRECKVTVAKQGRGAATLNRKVVPICRFIVQRLDCRYIPTVRDADAATKIVAEMLDRELQAVEQDPRYKASLDQITALQTPILEQVSASIKSTLVEFLPKIKDVKVGIAAEARIRALRRTDVIVDDGTETHLRFKGDGAQSLAAIALMRYAAERSASGRNLVIAVEEPESHLHPTAIHGLRAVLHELAKKHQIVITSHCPLFIDRSNIGANIIVHKKKARVAVSAREMRTILGVRAADNLMHADLVLLVEGEEDRIALLSLLRHSSAALKAAFADNLVAIDTLAGGSNLAYKTGLLRDSLCACHCFLDYDKAGRDAFEKAKAEGLLLDADVNFATCAGMNDSEIEDLYDVAVYKTMILNNYRVTLDSPKFKTSRKWSERMRETFKQQGKNWTDAAAIEVKRRIAEAVAANPQDAFNIHKRASFDALVSALEQRTKELHSQI